MTKPPRVTPGFETDLVDVIRRWGLDKQIGIPARVLTTHVMGALTLLETTLRRRDELSRRETGGEALD